MTKPDPEELEERRKVLANLLPPLREAFEDDADERRKAFAEVVDELDGDDDRYHGYVEAVDLMKMTVGALVSPEFKGYDRKLNGQEMREKIATLLAMLVAEMENLYVEHHLGVDAVIEDDDDKDDGLDGWEPPDWPDEDDDG